MTFRIAVFNQKGGVGKTTTTLNLGAAMARENMMPLMVDLDPQAHLSAIHGTALGDARNSVFAHYSDSRALSELLVEWPGIGHLVPAHAELIKVDSIFGKGPTVLNKLNLGLAALESTFPDRPVLIDCCPFLGVLSLNAVFAADHLLIPVSSDFLALRGALQLERTLKALEPVVKRRIGRRYLLTRFDRRRKMCFEIQARMQEQFGAELCTTMISENVAVAEAPSYSRDVFSHAQYSRGALDYAELFEELQREGILPA